MSTFAEYCLFLSHLISPSPCEGDVLGPLLEGYNVPAGQVHAEGRLQVKNQNIQIISTFITKIHATIQQCLDAKPGGFKTQYFYVKLEDNGDPSPDQPKRQTDIPRGGAYWGAIQQTFITQGKVLKQVQDG